jgi:hypothetical protein
MLSGDETGELKAMQSMRRTIPTILMLCLLSACGATSVAADGKPVIELFFQASKTSVAVFDDGRILVGQNEFRLDTKAMKQLARHRTSFLESMSIGVSYVPPELEHVDVVAFDGDSRIERFAYLERCGAVADAYVTDSVAQMVKLLEAAGYDRCIAPPTPILEARWTMPTRELRLYQDGTFDYTSDERKARGAIPIQELAKLRRVADSLREEDSAGWLSFVAPGFEQVVVKLPHGKDTTLLIAYVDDCSGTGKTADIEIHGQQLYRKVTQLLAFLKTGGIIRCPE